ncbi:MAG: zinc ribbon domain-containing protein [Muribaculaceae bacterium]|nr:zinc ribbon domain-containing protein [Muribaculaceae bacterium]
MNCQSCGNRLKPTDKYCTYCGQQIGNSQKKKRIWLALILSILVLTVAVSAVFFFWYVNKFRQTSTVELKLPDINKGDNSVNDNDARISESITFIIDGTNSKNQTCNDGVIYYYEGKPDLNTSALKEIKIDSVRLLLAERNNELISEIDKIKKEWSKGNIDDEKYKELVKKARDTQAADPNAHRVIVTIKPTPNAIYANVVRMLDEMQVNHITTYQIEALTKEDSILYKQTTGYPIRSK